MSRALAVDLLERIDSGGAYANLVVPAALAASDLEPRDRAFVTELVYGTTRMRRACDFLVDRFLLRPVEPRVRAVLRLGAYQLQFMHTPVHAAVSETVGVAPPRARGLVNAVLRRVAGAQVVWPDDATRLSYPDWIVERVVAELGPVAGIAALEHMNRPATVTERADGYVQDEASQWVAAIVGARAGDRVVDLCAAPGGKATALAATGAFVVANDVRVGRAGLMAANARRLGARSMVVIAADGRRPSLRRRRFDRVLVDAPCSGLGALRRRPDARWRIEEDDVDRLADLQCALLASAVDLLAPGGELVYSVCTLTAAESVDVAATVTLDPLPPPGPPWEPYGTGARLFPQTAGTDGMCVFRFTTGSHAPSGS